jgi:hypothetical protein
MDANRLSVLTGATHRTVTLICSWPRDGLSFDIEMTNASGTTRAGDPYRRVFLPDGVLGPGQSIDVTMRFRRHRRSLPLSFTLTLLSGQGNP